MRQRGVKAVENYTMPFLVMAYLLLFMGLVTLWALKGYVASLLLSLVFYAVIRMIDRRRTG